MAASDLRRLHTQTCHVGGGLHVLEEYIDQYLWLNQLLILTENGRGHYLWVNMSHYAVEAKCVTLCWFAKSQHIDH